METLEACVRAKRQGWEQLAKLETLSIFSPSALASLRQTYQPAVTNAESRFFVFWSELSDKPQLLRQSIWSQALSLEKQLYQAIYDRGIISAMTLDHLKHAINLKQDAILAATIPPPQQTQFPIASRWDKLMTALTMRFFPPKQWIGAQRDFIISYEYDVSVAYACANVAQRVKGLAEQIASWAGELAEGEALDATVVEECAQVYQHWSTTALQKIEAKTSSSPDLIVALQQKLARQAILAREQEALNQLIAEGVISPATSEQIRHGLEAAGS
jgi:hypothetical protein